jgi:hypothetical protein
MKIKNAFSTEFKCTNVEAVEPMSYEAYEDMCNRDYFDATYEPMDVIWDEQD